MKIKTEPITVRLPESWRPIAEDNWSIDGMEFTYSVIIRAALGDYMKQKGWMDD